jgi:hypothetical protein
MARLAGSRGGRRRRRRRRCASGSVSKRRRDISQPADPPLAFVTYDVRHPAGPRLIPGRCVIRARREIYSSKAPHPAGAAIPPSQRPLTARPLDKFHLAIRVRAPAITRRCSLHTVAHCRTLAPRYFEGEPRCAPPGPSSRSNIAAEETEEPSQLGPPSLRQALVSTISGHINLEAAERNPPPARRPRLFATKAILLASLASLAFISEYLYPFEVPKIPSILTLP